jgi:hypothetical protein
MQGIDAALRKRGYSSLEDLKAGKKRLASYSRRMPISMPYPRSQTTVTQFLRDALAVNRVRVCCGA